MIDSNSKYTLLYQQAEALVSGETDLIANAANLAALIYHNMEDLNWVGFYFLRDLPQPREDEQELVLGPFSGQPACTRIPIGKGVCGTAFATQSTQRIDNVHDFPGHIACDAASESELVVPFNAGSQRGVFDIDSPIQARFGDQEQEFFEAVASLIE